MTKRIIAIIFLSFLTATAIPCPACASIFDKISDVASDVVHTATDAVSQIKDGIVERAKLPREVLTRVRDEAIGKLSETCSEARQLTGDFRNNVADLYDYLDQNGKKLLSRILNEYKDFIKVMDPRENSRNLLVSILAEMQKPLWENARKMSKTLKEVQLSPFKDPSLRYDQLCTLCAHNAYSNFEQGYITYGQQMVNIEKQLLLGIRTFMLDTWTDDTHKQIVLSHGKPSVQILLRPIAYATKLLSQPLLLEDTLKLFARFLKEHPGEIITIILEDNVDPKYKHLYATAVKNAKLDQEIFAESDYTAYNAERRQTLGAEAQDVWPTIKYLVDKKKRLFVFTDRLENSSLFLSTRRHMVENMYGTLDKNEACKELGASRDGVPKDTNRNLLLLNWFDDDPLNEATDILPVCLETNWANPMEAAKSIATIVGLMRKGIADISPMSHVKTNDGELAAFLKQHLDRGLSESNAQRHPNFIAVDFITCGNPLKHVQKINATPPEDRGVYFRPMHNEVRTDRPNTWIKVPGLGYDIGCNKNDGRWLIGTGSGPGGWSPYYWESRSNRPEDWGKRPGFGRRIDAGPMGVAWMLNDSHKLYRFEKGQWHQEGTALAHDIGVGLLGDVCIVGTDRKVYWLKKENGKYNHHLVDETFNKGENLDVDNHGNPWVVSTDKRLYRLKGGKLREVPLDFKVIDVGVGPNNIVWLSTDGTNGKNVYRIVGNASPELIPHAPTPRSISVDDDGRGVIITNKQEIWKCIR